MRKTENRKTKTPPIGATATPFLIEVRGCPTPITRIESQPRGFLGPRQKIGTRGRDDAHTESPVRGALSRGLAETGYFTAGVRPASPLPAHPPPSTSHQHTRSSDLSRNLFKVRRSSRAVARAPRVASPGQAESAWNAALFGWNPSSGEAPSSPSWSGARVLRAAVEGLGRSLRETRVADVPPRAGRALARAVARPSPDARARVFFFRAASSKPLRDALGFFATAGGGSLDRRAP